MLLIAGLEQASGGRIQLGGDADITVDDRRPAGALPPRSHRHRLPGFPPHPHHDRARERGDAAGARRQNPAPSRSRASPWKKSGWAIASAIIRASFPAASSSASPSRGRWRREPDILLADEPTGNLDTETGQKVIELLFGMQQRRGVTLLLITHDPALARRCDRIIHLADGRIVSEEVGRSQAAAK